PRIWLTTQLLSDISQKRDANDPDWLAVKSAADAYLTQRVPRVTIVAATSTNPVEFTSSENLPWSGTVTSVYLKGASGAWAGVNNNPAVNAWTATATGAHTFTLPVDASAFGSFSGQSITFFMAGGENEPDILGYGYQGSDWYDAILQLGLV